MSSSDSNTTPDIESVLAGEGRAHGRRFLWPAGILLLAGILGGAWWYFPGDSDSTLEFVTAPVARDDIVVTVTATGSLEPTNQVEVGTEISGTIETVEVEYNQRVQQGDVLARLDTDRLEAKVVEARSALEAARAKLEEAKATVLETSLIFKRRQELAPEEITTPEELDNARAAHARAQAEQASAKAQIAQAEANLALCETDLRKAVIRAPIDGIILERAVEPGQTVAASLQTPVLFILAENLTQMELHVNVDEADVGKVAEGQHASFTVDAYPDAEFPATISLVRYAPRTVDGVVSYETTLDVDNSDLLLRPGMTATAEVTVETVEDVLLVANAALRFMPPAAPTESDNRGLIGRILPGPPHRMGSQRQQAIDTGKRQEVWVVRAGQAVPVPVTVGVTDGKVTEIVSGELLQGDKVILDVSQGQ